LCRLLSSCIVQEVRGEGLLVGVQLDTPAGPVVAAARDKGLIAITAGAGDVVRLVPPLTCSDEEIDIAVQVLGECISAL
jgi:acetylornithine aminotransferase